MEKIPLLLICTLSLLSASFAAPGTAKPAPIGGNPMPLGGANGVAEESRKRVDDFNQRFIDSCRSMDNARTVELWADDGVDLLPGMEPMVGKAAISQWLRGLTEQMKGAKVLQCDVDWQNIQISGDVAYEWGVNTQTVSVPNQTEPFKNKGKITLILRKQSDGNWKLVLESWNGSPQAKPGS